MEIVPVIDLKGGAVVRAVGGERASYRPIETPLSPTSDPVDVVAGLLRLFPFRTLYCADLDAIEGRGGSHGPLRRIKAAFPSLALWLDDGCAGAASAGGFLEENPGDHLIIGSESLRDGAVLDGLRAHPRVLLSLDFRGDAFQGPPEVLGRPQLWPDRVIVMTLARVGSGDGPDRDRLSAVRALAGPRRVYAAGGVRNIGDLRVLAADGVAGALVASALHDRRLGADDLATLAM
jgi:phosphoribosylformimino-5-aminoimidazole carboxamide ribotide isomerase